MRHPSPRNARLLEDLTPLERKGCQALEGLEVIFDIRKVLELEYRKVDLKLFIGIHFLNYSWFSCCPLLFIIFLLCCYDRKESDGPIPKRHQSWGELED